MEVVFKMDRAMCCGHRRCSNHYQREQAKRNICNTPTHTPHHTTHTHTHTHTRLSRCLQGVGGFRGLVHPKTSEFQFKSPSERPHHQAFFLFSFHSLKTTWEFPPWNSGLRIQLQQLGLLQRCRLDPGPSAVG